MCKTNDRYEEWKKFPFLKKHFFLKILKNTDYQEPVVRTTMGYVKPHIKTSALYSGFSNIPMSSHSANVEMSSADDNQLLVLLA